MQAKEMQIVKHSDHYELWLVNGDDEAGIALSPEAMQGLARTLQNIQDQPMSTIKVMAFDLDEED